MILSQIAYDLPEPSDNVFVGGPEGLGYVGGQTTLAGMYKNAQFSWYKNGETLSSMWSHYVRDCFLLPASSSVGGESTLNKVLRSEDLATDIAPTTTGYGPEFIQYDGHIKTCQEFWSNDLHNELLAFTGDINTSKKYLELGSALGYYGALIDNTTAMSSASELKGAVTQAVLSNEFSTTFKAMGIAGQVMADGAAQATADIQLNGISTGLYMAEQLPMVAFIVFLLMVAAFPFILAFALLPGSLSTLANYSKTLLWVSLWEPMGNILGVFQDYRFIELAKSLNFASSGSGEMIISPYNLINISSEAATMAGIAGFMFLAVQGLSWMLITGSGQMMGNLMSQFGGAFSHRANADAQLQTRSEMASNNMLSAEMGEQISMREMYQYNAMAQAGAMAGGSAGGMMAYGRDSLSAAKSMAHASSVKAAFGHGQDIGMTRELGTGATAAATGRRTAIQSTAATLERSQRLATDAQASEVGHVEGAVASANSMAVSQAYGGSSDAAFDTHSKITAENEGKSMGGVSNVGSAAEAMRRGQTLGVDEAMNASAKANVLNGQSAEDRMNTLDYQHKQNITVPSETIKKFADEQGISKQEALNKMVENSATMEAAKMLGSDASIQAQGGADKALDNAKTVAKYQSNQLNSTAKAIREANSNGIATSEITDMEASSKMGGIIELARLKQENNKEAQAATQRLEAAQQSVNGVFF